jgi:hypothetical protein
MNLWKQFIVGVCLCLCIPFKQSIADEITIHFMPAPVEINWSNPHALLVSTIMSGLTITKSKQHAIGHVSVELKCDSMNLHHFSGMTSKNADPTLNVLIRNYGMAALFVVNKGKHETSKDVKKYVSKHHRVGRSSFFTVEVQPESCARAYAYYKEFDELGYGKMYSGLNLRPRYREGAGCSAYGASYLDINNVLIPEIEAEWMTSVLVPMKYVGKPMTDKKISVFKILKAVNARWAKPHEPHIPLHFYDPDKMHDWALQAYKRASLGEMVAGYKMHPEKRGKSFGVRVDMTHVDTPTDSFWKVRPSL